MEKQAEEYYELICKLGNHFKQIGDTQKYDTTSKETIQVFLAKESGFKQFLRHMFKKQSITVGHTRPTKENPSEIAAKDLKAILRDKEQEIQRLRHHLEEEIKSSEQALRQVEQHLQEKSREASDFATRLSEEMNCKVISNEQNFENISIKNRPMNIADEYRSLCSEEWFRAKEELDSRCPELEESKRFELLCKVYTSAVEIAQSMKTKVLNQITNLLIQPLDTIATTTQIQEGAESNEIIERSREQNELSQLFSQIRDVLRIKADSVITTSIVNQIKCSMCEDKTSIDSYRELITGEKYHMLDFLKECSKLAWKMVIQEPPLRFDISGKHGKCDERKQEVFWGSGNPSSNYSIISYYVHPAMCQGQSVLVKGRVYLMK